MKNKVNGWIYLLCLILLIIFPVGELINIYVEYTTTSEYFEVVKGLKDYVIIDIVSTTILMFLSIYSGISLFQNKPFATKLTKIFLILVFINGALQKSYTIAANLDLNYSYLMDSQLEANWGYAILFFTILFTYLIYSDLDEKNHKEEKTNSDELIYLSEEKIDSFYFETLKEKMGVNFRKLKKMFFESINKLTTPLNNGLVNLESDEIIIISLVFATLISLIIGFQLGEVNYYLFNGNRVDKHYPGRTYEEFSFNYLIGVSSFIVFGGILYVFLKIKNKR